jgi:hypothetical protein
MVSQRIPEDISAAELAKESARRELVERAKWVYNRREARNRLVMHILRIPEDDVDDSGATTAFRELMGKLVVNEVQDREKMPNNGEINIAGPREWWNDWSIKQVSPHPAIIDIESGRRTELRVLRQMYMNLNPEEFNGTGT